MRLFGLIGYPLSHSFSERYFTEKFEKEGIDDCRYKTFPLSDINELPAFLKVNPMLCGLNVTIPYKREVIPFLDELHLPHGLNACNCIRLENGLLYGYNTDWLAFRESVRPRLDNMNSALVLGNGGASEAVKFALENLGVETHIVSRVAGNGATYTYDMLDQQVIDDHKLIVNTTPLGLYPNTLECPDIPYDFLTWEHLLFDLIYNPTKTLFLQKGEEKGASTMNGKEMLVLQAEESWRIWNH